MVHDATRRDYSAGAMKLTLYPLTTVETPLRPASARRDWMDAARDAFPYRCLPLALANQHGWEFYTPFDFEAEWTGGTLPEDVEVRSDAPIESGHPGAPLANFGEGVLTFELSVMLRTPPGWNIFLTGPLNCVKDGIAPLSGVIETDWSPYTFTMNWRFTRPGTVRFAAGEAIATLFPVRRDLFETIEPEVADLHSDKDTYAHFMTWRQQRADFAERLRRQETSAVQEKWQKTYYRGLNPDGSQGPDDHRIKLRVKPFKA